MSASAMVVCTLSSEGKTSDDEIPPPIRYERLPGVTAWQLIWLVPDQGQRYCYCLAVKQRLCVLQERTHLYDNQGKNLLCCDILDGNVSGAQLPEHFPDREGA